MSTLTHPERKRRPERKLSLPLAVCAADEDVIIIADEAFCRHQSDGGAGRRAMHAARAVEGALPEPWR